MVPCLDYFLCILYNAAIIYDKDHQDFVLNSFCSWIPVIFKGRIPLKKSNSEIRLSLLKTIAKFKADRGQ